MAGCTGRDVTRRGADVADRAAWSIGDLQELLDEWVIAGWQSRPHEGLRHPFTPDRAASPNEAYAAMVAAAGYVPIALSGEDYIELLPVEWRTINEGGIQIGYRTYNSHELRTCRGQPSQDPARNNRVEVHYDPYDVSRVWVRDTRRDRWVTVPWLHLAMVRQPFAEFTWRYARQAAALRGVDDTNEAAVAVVLAGLLARAEQGPARGRRILARDQTANALPSRAPLPQLPAAPEPDDHADHDLPDDPVDTAEPAPPDPPPARRTRTASAAAVGGVEPFRLFDPFEEGERW